MSLPEASRELISPPVDIFVLSRPNFDFDRFSQFLSTEKSGWTYSQEAKDAELLVEASGRFCYMSFGERQYRKDTFSYVRNLIEMGHESVLEHAVWTFVLQNVSRAFTHQLVRHRVGFSFSQLSQQYHEEGDARFVPPREVLNNANLLKSWLENVSKSRYEYRRLLEGLKSRPNDFYSEDMARREVVRAERSAARSLLPNCTATKIVVTANARSIRNFISLRGSTLGDYEMAEVSVLLLRIMKEEAPMLFSDFLVELCDGVEQAVLI